MSWRILIERGNLEFSAAHFITFGGKCEPLHGHNYGVRVEAEGALTTDSYVFDFVVLKDIVRTLIKDWDHRFLLPTRSPHLRVTVRARGVGQNLARLTVGIEETPMQAAFYTLDLLAGESQQSPS